MTETSPAEAPARGVGEVVVAVVVALAVGLLVLVGWFPNIAVPEASEPIGLISRLYDPPDRSIERALNIGDGQIYATQAVDPLAQRDDLLLGGPEEIAYRYQRGAYGWIGWAASAGQAEPVPWALAVVTCLSVALLVGVVADVIRRQGGPILVALVLLFTPGVITGLFFVGPEVLGTALLVAGMAAWRRSPGSLMAVTAFAAAGLCRESFLLVPLVLGGVALVDRRRDLVLRAAATAVPYGVWVLYLRVAVGAWPRGSTEGRLSLIPFGGLVGHDGTWGLDDIAGMSLTVGLGVLGLIWGRDREIRAVIGAHLLMAATFGPSVWSGNYGTGRVLLPIAALGLVELARPRHDRSPAAVVPEPDAVGRGHGARSDAVGVHQPV